MLRTSCWMQDIPSCYHPSSSLETFEDQRQREKLPFVACSLWAARGLYQGITDFMLCLPCYCTDKGCKANSASAALNKWLKQTIGDGYVMHGFRHSMRDKLRAVNCPSEMIDQIGGWSKQSVGEGYGEGFEAGN